MPQYQNYAIQTAMQPSDKLLYFQNSAGALKTITFDDFANSVVGSTAVTGLPAVSSIAELQAYDISTVPNNGQLSVSGYYAAGDGGGGLFYYNSTSTATSDGGTVFAPNSGVGRWFRLIQGKALATKMFGAYADGTRDDTAALQLAFTAMRALAPNVTLLFSPGTYLTTQTLLVEGNQVKIFGQNSTLKAKVTFSGTVLQIGDGAAGPAIEFLEINDLFVDADNKVPYGIHIKESQNVGFINVIANSGTTAAWYIDGSASGGTLRLINLLFENCFAGSATQACIGYLFNKGGNTGAYERFTMLGCGAESCTNLIKTIGSFGMEIIGGTFQNASAPSLYVDASQVICRGAYFEAGGGGIDLRVDNAATVTLSGTAIGGGVTYSDAVSTVVTRDGTYNTALGPLITPSNTGRIADRTDSWGNPQWPTGVGGALSPKGLSYTDKMGTVWQCITPHPNSTYVPRDGRIIIPMPYNEFSNGKLWWWAMEDFVVTEMYFVVTTTYTGTATVTGFGNADAAQSSWISTTQGAIGNLVAGAVINAADNAHADKILDGTKKKYLAGKGNLPINAQPSAVVQYGSATTWTAGMGYLIIYGYNLKFN